VERRDVRMRGFRPTVPLFLAEWEFLDEADRITIPRGDIEILADLPVIEIVDEAHEIMGDPSVRRMLADDLALHPVVGSHLPGLEAPEIEPRRRIGFGDGQVRQHDILEARHLHRPEDIAPGFVELLGRLVAQPQPSAECLQVFRPPGLRRVVAAIFVIRLPAIQRRMFAVALGDDLDDASAFTPPDF
jgi:hypothetical protein